MYYQVVFSFDEDESDPRFSIRSETSEDASREHISIRFNPVFLEREGIELDNHGFPTTESLEAWHKKNNPQLFIE